MVAESPGRKVSVKKGVSASEKEAPRIAVSVIFALAVPAFLTRTERAALFVNCVSGNGMV